MEIVRSLNRSWKSPGEMSRGMSGYRVSGGWIDEKKHSVSGSWIDEKNNNNFKSKQLLLTKAVFNLPKPHLLLSLNSSLTSNLKRCSSTNPMLIHPLVPCNSPNLLHWARIRENAFRSAHAVLADRKQQQQQKN